MDEVNSLCDSVARWLTLQATIIPSANASSLSAKVIAGRSSRPFRDNRIFIICFRKSSATAGAFARAGG